MSKFDFLRQKRSISIKKKRRRKKVSAKLKKSKSVSDEKNIYFEICKNN